MSLENILKDTLEKAGGIEPATLGKTEALSVSKDDKRRLIQQLENDARFNNMIIVAIVFLHFALFALASFLIVSNPERITVILGGSLLGLMVLMYSLIHVWKIKMANDYLRAIIPNLPPEQAMVAAQSIYFEIQRKKWA